MKTSLEAILGTRPESWRVFSYRDDFGELWGATGPLYRAADSGYTNVFLIWDGIPTQVGSNPHSINVVDHLTAFDWVVSLCCALNAATDLRRLRVFFLDLQPPEHSTAFATRAFPQFLSQLPWVRVYRPAARHEGILNAIKDPDFVRSHLGPDSLGAEALLRDLGVGEAVANEGNFPFFKKDPDSVRLLQQVWQAELTKAEGRHSIANFIGPMMLLQSMGLTSQAIEGTDAFRTLMEKIGLFPLPEQEPLPWVEETEWSRSVDRFVLVDDMASLGWKAFVRNGLQIRYDNQLSVHENPDARGFGDGGQTIFDLLADDGGKLRVRKGVSISGGKKEILLLDLRLFASRRVDEESSFLGKLLDLARQAPMSDSTLPWPGFSDADFAAMDRGIKANTRGNDDYYMALTLLPRLLALVDPTLPIVLFSSTGQRAIMNALRGYGTIITDFDKPRFHGEGSETVVSEVKERFKRAIKRAITISKARRLYRDIMASGTAPFPAVPRTPVGGTRRQLEIYIDESGSGNEMKVGGLALLYPDSTSVSGLSQVMVDMGLVWGRDRENPDRPRPQNYLRKRPGDWDEVKDKLIMLGSLLEGRDTYIAAFNLEATTPAVNADVLQDFGPDQTFRALLDRVLEFLLFFWPPARESDIDINIFVATRTPSVNQTKAEGWNEHWGIGCQPNLRPRDPDETHRCYVFSSDDVHPILETILARVPWTGALPKVVIGRGVTLDYYDRPIDTKAGDLPRQIHYAADWVVSCPTQVPSEWWDNGFSDNWDKVLDDQLRAGREAEIADRVASLHAWYLAEEHSLGRPKVRRPIGAYIQEKVKSCNKEIAGEDFKRLCDLISLT